MHRERDDVSNPGAGPRWKYKCLFLLSFLVRALGMVLPQGCGVSAFFGTWPGDETEAELLEQLRAMG